MKNFLNHLKISGYIQTQFQWTDSAGAPAYYSGGDFGLYSNNRFMIRRGRLSLAYEANIAKAAFQFDMTEKGFALKDAYIAVCEPFLKAFTLTTGLFYKPFGYELSYSSSLRESPERARIIQTIFPMERDLGVSLTFNMPETSVFHFLKIQAGIFNGNAINTEIDQFKDLCARIQISNPVKSSFVDYSVGLSYYNGKYNHIYDFDGKNNHLRYIYTMQNSLPDSNGVTSMIFDKDTSYMKKGRRECTPIKREYFGGDAQISFNFPFGKTTLRAEYIFGTQPAPFDDKESIYARTSESSVGMYPGYYFSGYTNPTVVRPGMVKPSLKYTNTYIRKFNGACFYFIQNIWKTRHQIVVKYEWYDPNTAVSGKDVKPFYIQGGSNIATNLSAGDIKYSTLGFGLNLFYKEIMLMIYYEIVKNEITDIGPFDDSQLNDNNFFPSSGFSKNVKDNVLTIRLQYKF